MFTMKVIQNQTGPRLSKVYWVIVGVFLRVCTVAGIITQQGQILLNCIKKNSEVPGLQEKQ